MVNYIIEYYENEAISQSQLKLLLGNNPSAFNSVREPELYFEEKRHFIIGSAVDCLLTQSQEEFNRTYHVSTMENKPTEVIMSIINKAFDTIVEQHPMAPIYPIQDNNYKQIIIDSIHEHEYRNNWTDDTKWSKICEYYEYWEELRNSQSKTILSTEENDIISQIVMSLRTSEVTSKYFETSETKEVLYQLPIYWVYDDVECKALLDMVSIDHKEKTIQPIDIKTLGDYTINFPKSLRQRRYDIQAAFYTEACEDLKNSLNLYDYKILPFKFLVESTTEPGTPLVFTCNDSLLKIGKYGRPEIYYEGHVVTQEVRGFHDLIQLYKYYQENGFEVDQKIKQNQSEFEIDWNGIII